MIKKIAILGSTGSIGQTTCEIIKKNKKDFKVVLLSTNSNINKIYKQALLLDVKNLIIKNKLKYFKYQNKFQKRKIKVFFNDSDLNKIVKKKIDYTMCSVSGLAGLKSTLKAIEFSKAVGIANKESIVCAWNLISKKLKKYNTKFIPIDSEHYSIWTLLQNTKINSVNEIIITASGGPFLNTPMSQLSKIKLNQALNHPVWSMGKKISIDSSTMMNKIFEIIEAQKIFNLDVKKFKILIHPKSYIHSIVKFNNGIIKILAHDTDMRIPIINSIYNNNKIIKTKINLKNLNNLELSRPDVIKFPSIKFLKYLNNKNSMFETILTTANDQLVEFFMKNKIKYLDIIKYLNKIINLSEFKPYFKKKPKDLNQIIKLSTYVKLKTKLICEK
jgi:1-deoxy-D-xylulose-5-phosphate reductoisomerase